MSREGSRALPAIEILKLSALSLCAGMLGVGSWEFFIEHVIPSDFTPRDAFWWEIMEIGFISSVFAILTVPIWLRVVRNLDLARAEATQSVSILDNIFHATPGLNAISDPATGTHIDVSERWLSALGYQREEVIGKTASELHIWPTAKTRTRLIKEMERTNGHLRDYETQICSKAGVAIDVLVSGEKIIYEGKERLFLIAQDISAHKRAERELRESERRARAAEQLLKDAIESVSDGFVLYGANSRLIICNKKFKEIYNYSDTDVAPGATWATLGELDIKRNTVVTADEREYLDRRDINEGPPKSFPIRLADGRSILVRDRKTLSGGIVSIQTDVTATESLLEELRHAHAELEERVVERTKDLELEIVERKTAEIKLRDALAAVQVADQAKTEFLATMSHELRTPLNAIIGFTSVMREGHFGKIEIPRYQDYLADIQASGEHLLSLINDILDVSAVEAGKLELFEEEFNLSDIIESSVSLVSIRADKGGVDVSIAEIDGTDYFIRADERRLRQILVNLLTNAVKFTPSGGAVQVETNIRPDSDITIMVTDSGVGMTEGDIRKAMQPFTQIGSNALVRSNEGTGLGLPLTKALVEMHDGELIIESAPDIGTIATVKLPASRIV